MHAYGEATKFFKHCKMCCLSVLSVLCVRDESRVASRCEVLCNVMLGLMHYIVLNGFSQQLLLAQFNGIFKKKVNFAKACRMGKGMLRISKKLLYVWLTVCVCGVGEMYAQGRLMTDELVRGSDGMGGGIVEINQAEILSDALRQKLIVSRSVRELKGYRVRVYRGLGRNAREMSVELAAKLKEEYPDMKVYRAYQAPYYLVTVGNFRMRIDALSLQYKLLKNNPQAFVVEENIEYPPLCAGKQTAASEREI